MSLSLLRSSPYYSSCFLSHFPCFLWDWPSSTRDSCHRIFFSIQFYRHSFPFLFLRGLKKLFSLSGHTTDLQSSFYGLKRSSCIFIIWSLLSFPFSVFHFFFRVLWREGHNDSRTLCWLTGDLKWNQCISDEINLPLLELSCVTTSPTCLTRDMNLPLFRFVMSRCCFHSFCLKFASSESIAITWYFALDIMSHFYFYSCSRYDSMNPWPQKGIEESMGIVCQPLPPPHHLPRQVVPTQPVTRQEEGEGNANGSMLPRVGDSYLLWMEETTYLFIR